jgi:hypothetical protein
MRWWAPLAIVLLLAGTPTTTTPYVVYSLESPNCEPDGYFGWSVCMAGDVNGDGYDDVVVGAYKEDPGTSPAGAGRVYVFSGATGDTLYTLVSPNEEAGGNLGCWVSGAGDVNNDSNCDLIVGARNEDPGSSPNSAGRAYILNGPTGGVLYTLASPNEELNGRFGCSVCGAGDGDGDGHHDVVVGAHGEAPGSSPTGAGRAYVFSGATGETLHTLTSPNEEADGYLGWSVSAVGDTDGDGHDDVVVGAPYEDPGPSPGDAGRAYVFSGATGALIHTLASPNEETGGCFGHTVCGAGDVDTDGRQDVVVGAWAENPGPSPEDAGRAYVFSGATGALLLALSSPDEEGNGRFGWSVCGVGDLNHDGHDDLAVGAPFEDPGSSPDSAGRVHVFSGATGTPLWTFSSPNEEWWGRFGWSVSGARDVNADFCSDLIVGAYREDVGGAIDAGRAYVFTPAVLLTGHVAGGILGLHWTTCTGASAYWVYGAANQAYFPPGLAPPHVHRLQVLPSTTTEWSTANGVGEVDTSWTYIVIAVDSVDDELCRSNRFGEHDFGAQTVR